MKTAMVQMGGEVSVETSRRCARGVVQSALNAYRRQLNKWWPDALYAKYSEMDDDGKRQCLVSYLQNPASGGFSPGGYTDATPSVLALAPKRDALLCVGR